MKKSITLILTFIIIFSYTNTTYVSAATTNSYKGNTITKNNGYNLTNNYNANSPLCKKLKREVDNNTGKINKKLEQELNKLGVFDEEILDFDNTLIENLESGSKYNVSIEYLCFENDSCTLLGDNDIDDLIDEVYEEETSESKPFNLSDLFGISSVTAHAAKTGTDHGFSSGGYLKQTLFLSQDNSSSNIYVFYTATWVKQPKYRNIDIAGVTLKNASPIKKTFVGSYTTTCHDTIYNPYREVYKQYKKNFKEYGEVEYTTDGIAVSYDLISDHKKINSVNMSGTVLQRYENDKVQFAFYATIDEKKSWRYIVATGHYLHHQSSTVVEPSISITSADISVGVSYDSYYKKMANNPYIQFYFYK